MGRFVRRWLRGVAARGGGPTLFGRPRAWYWVVMGSWALRSLRRAVGRQQVIQRVDLPPGKTVEIRHLTRRYGESSPEDDGPPKR